MPFRDLKNVLRRHSARRADVSRQIFVHPVGKGLHLVRAPGCQLERVVGTSAGSTTFGPGSEVLVGSVQGSRQQSILGSPPPAFRGASAFGLRDTSTSISSPRILSFSPSEILIGVSDQLVYIIGTGLTEDPLDVFRTVAYDDDGIVIDDPLSDLHDITWIPDPAVIPLNVSDDHQVVSVLIDVSASALDPFDMFVEVVPAS